MKKLSIILLCVLLLPYVSFSDDTCKETQCKYTASEVDTLIQLIHDDYVWGTPCGFTGFGDGTVATSRPYMPEDLDRYIDSRIKIYMAACIKANDIIKEYCKEDKKN